MNAAAVAVCADSGSDDTTVKSEWGGFYGSVGGCQRVQEVHARIQTLCFSLCVVFLCEDRGEWRACSRTQAPRHRRTNTHSTALGSF